MRRRPSSRLLILDQSKRLLLFRFVHTQGALAGRDYWATPGGALEEGESFAAAAIRELFEETGLRIDSVGQIVAQQEFELQLTNGERVIADERFFVVHVSEQALSREHWTPAEMEVITDHRWWTMEELRTTHEMFFPELLVDFVRLHG